MASVRWCFAVCMLTSIQASTFDQIMFNKFFDISEPSSCEVDPLDETCVQENYGVLPLGRCEITVRNLVKRAENEYVSLVAIHFVTGRKQSLGLYRDGALVPDLGRNPASGRTPFEWPIRKRDVIRWRAGGFPRFHSLGSKAGWKLCLRTKKGAFDIQREGSAHCVQDLDPWCVEGWNSGNYGRCVLRVRSLPNHHYTLNEVVVASSNTTGIVTLRRDGMLVAQSNSQGSDWPILEGDHLEWFANNEMMKWKICIRPTTLRTVTRNEIFSIENDAASCSVDPHDRNCVRLRNFAGSRQCQVSIHSLPFDEPVFATPSSLRVEEDEGMLGLYRVGDLVQGVDSNPAGGMETDFWWPVEAGDQLNWTTGRSPGQLVADGHGFYYDPSYNASTPAWKVCLATQRPKRSFFFKEYGPCVVDPDEPMCVERRNYGDKEKCVCLPTAPTSRLCCDRFFSRRRNTTDSA